MPQTGAYFLWLCRCHDVSSCIVIGTHGVGEIFHLVSFTIIECSHHFIVSSININSVFYKYRAPGVQKSVSVSVRVYVFVNLYIYVCVCVYV